MKKKLSISYQEFSDLGQLPEQDQELVKAAIAATKNSYAPYSRFHVGAAVLLENGKIISGANQENAAFPSGLCAERTAMFSASANYPGVPQISIAIAAEFARRLVDSPASPCGACRQVMAEYQKIGGKPMSIILYGRKVIRKFEKVDDLLPFIFDNI